MLPLARQNTTLILGILDHAKYCSFSQSIILRQITTNSGKVLVMNKIKKCIFLGNFWWPFISGGPLLLSRIHKLVLHLIQLILLHKLIWSSFSHCMAGHKVSSWIMQVWNTIMCIICDNMLARCLCSSMNNLSFSFAYDVVFWI